MERVLNFSAGPAMLPIEVMEIAAKEMTNYGGSGMSVLEMSHRSKAFIDIAAEAEKNFRELMGVPPNYKVLFLQGGATLQFAMVPMNLFRKSYRADYVNTGQFAKKALVEAKKYGKVTEVATSESDTYKYIPELDKSKFDPEADYFHYCMNNTIFGTRFTEVPETGDVTLVADVSSLILSQEIDVTKFGLLYAGAQKNIGPSGVTVVMIREDLVGFAKPEVPTMLDYKIHVDGESMHNTPPCYGIYIAKLVFDHLKARGGVKAMQKANEEKAAVLYDFIDGSALFKGVARKKDRSMMNVTFVTGDLDLDAKFVKEATKAGFVSIAGHRSVGGMRASIYNAFPAEGVQRLVDFMKKFETENK